MRYLDLIIRLNLMLSASIILSMTQVKIAAATCPCDIYKNGERPVLRLTARAALIKHVYRALYQ